MNRIEYHVCSHVMQCGRHVLTQFDNFTDFPCLCCWCFGLADFAECTFEVCVHHAVDVPLEVSQDDTLRMTLHLNGYWIVCFILHGSAVP